MCVPMFIESIKYKFYILLQYIVYRSVAEIYIFLVYLVFVFVQCCHLLRHYPYSVYNIEFTGFTMPSNGGQQTFSFHFCQKYHSSFLCVRADWTI